MNSEPTVTLYIQLLEEGTDTARATQAIPLGNGLYRLLPTSNYNPESEVWEFLPGSVVRCAMVMDKFVEPLFLAVEKVA